MKTKKKPSKVKGRPNLKDIRAYVALASRPFFAVALLIILFISFGGLVEIDPFVVEMSDMFSLAWMVPTVLGIFVGHWYFPSKTAPRDGVEKLAMVMLGIFPTNMLTAITLNVSLPPIIVAVVGVYLGRHMWRNKEKHKIIGY